MTVKHGEHNITNEHGSSVGSMDTKTLEGSFGSSRPPMLLSVTVSIGDETNGALSWILRVRLVESSMSSVPPRIDHEPPKPSCS